DRHTITYRYYGGGPTLPVVGADAAFAEQANEFVEDVADANGTTTFSYQIDAGTRKVSDPRPGFLQTIYTVNAYGATTKVEAPLGKISIMEWATPDNPRPDLVPGNPNLPGVDAVMVAVTDALGRRTEYQYDAEGNVIKETVTFAGEDAKVRPVTEAD